MGISAKKINLLLVEDNPGDILLTKKAFGESPLIENIHVISDGEEAIRIMNDDDQTDIKFNMVILDINLPKRSGHEVLSEIKKNARLRSIPVIVMSSSRAEQEINRVYEAHASSYIVKPVSLPDFFDVASSIENFWFKQAQLPRC